jgi:AraC-like DNA-binding protein
MGLHLSEFLDFDEFAKTIRDVDCLMMMQNPGDRSWKVKQTFINKIELQFGNLGSGNIVEGSSWVSGFLFYLPISKSTTYSLNGQKFLKNEIMVLEPGSNFCLSTRSAHNWISIFVPIDVFEKYNFFYNFKSGPLLQNSGLCYVSSPHERIFNNIVNISMLAFEAAEISANFAISKAAEVIERNLIGLCAQTLVQNDLSILNHGGRPRFSRNKIIELSKKFDGDFISLGMKIKKLAELCGVSERTLRNVFGEYYLTSPTDYFKLKQLHQIRNSLKESDNDRTVSSTFLNNYAFEFGRTSVQYKELFGEAPSATLKKFNPTD